MFVGEKKLQDCNFHIDKERLVTTVPVTKSGSLVIEHLHLFIF